MMLLLELEQDTDGSWWVSEADCGLAYPGRIGYMYGTGETVSEALEDFAEVIREYADIIRESAEAGDVHDINFWQSLKLLVLRGGEL